MLPLNPSGRFRSSRKRFLRLSFLLTIWRRYQVPDNFWAPAGRNRSQTLEVILRNPGPPLSRRCLWPVS